MKSLATIALSMFALVSACAQDATPPAKPDPVERLQQLSEQLHNRYPGVTVRTNGIDPLEAFEVIADALIEIERRRQLTPIWNTCFQYNLTINQAISPETAAAIARELQDALPKIEEACALVHGGAR